VSPSQINFQIPAGTPIGTSPPKEIQVIKSATGQILASGFVAIDAVSPGLFTSSATGGGQLAALNQDNTVNDGTHPAKAGSVIQLFGTGQGLIPNLPADGVPATGLITTDDPLIQVIINTGPAVVQYSGLAPGYVGLWQINAVIPKDAIGNVFVAVVYKGVNSNLDQFGNRRFTTINVTQ
jgi:uncharacterized protein (TIGR03437 family)